MLFMKHSIKKQYPGFSLDISDKNTYIDIHGIEKVMDRKKTYGDFIKYIKKKFNGKDSRFTLLFIISTQWGLVIPVFAEYFDDSVNKENLKQASSRYRSVPCPLIK